MNRILKLLGIKKIIEHKVEVDSVSKLSRESEEKIVSRLLANAETRRLLEEYIAWKIGVRTREAIRGAGENGGDDDRYTFGRKERIHELAEITVDFKNIWERVKARDASSRT